jgi:hypothetical protein
MRVGVKGSAHEFEQRADYWQLHHHVEAFRLPLLVDAW